MFGRRKAAVPDEYNVDVEAEERAGRLVQHVEGQQLAECSVVSTTAWLTPITISISSISSLSLPPSLPPRL